MSEKITFKMNPGRNTYAFPEQCIVCGRSRTEPLRRELSSAGKKIASTVNTRTYINHVAELNIPYCHQHRKVAKMIWPVLLISVFVGFLLGVTAAAGVLLALGVESDTLIVIGLIIFGIGGGILVAWLGKTIATRFIDPAFQQVPRWPDGYWLGMTVKLWEDRITFSFDDDQFAEAFRALNRHR
jgi:hypothetical protein